jgi:hypothetical protein
VVLGDENAQTLIACVADGAGTAAFGAEGSAIACEAMIESAVAFSEAKRKWESFERSDAVAWCELARQEIQASAERHQCGLRDFATTLCVAIVAPSCAAFFQIGDGAIILKNRGGVYGVVFWPQSGRQLHQLPHFRRVSRAPRIPKGGEPNGLRGPVHGRHRKAGPAIRDQSAARAVFRSAVGGPPRLRMYRSFDGGASSVPPIRFDAKSVR